MKKARIGAVAVGALVFTALVSGAALAKPEFYQRIPEGYNKSCNLCHVAPPVLNDFGERFKAAGFSFEFDKKTGDAAGAAAGATAATAGAAQGAGSSRVETSLELRVPAGAEAGKSAGIVAVLEREGGEPVGGAVVRFYMASDLFVKGEVALGDARTGPDGRASLAFEPRSTGKLGLSARFTGDDALLPSRGEAVLSVGGVVVGYVPYSGIRVPFLGAWTLFAAVGAVWVGYLWVAWNLAVIRREGGGASDLAAERAPAAAVGGRSE